jgi:hypothetical protein
MEPRGGQNHPQWARPPNFYFIFFNEKYIFLIFLKIKIKNKLHDTCQILIGPCVVLLSQLTVNRRNNQFGPLSKPQGPLIIKIKP